jgi:serine phosphatase RsbU (regulator of sigma subunit)
MLIIRLCYNSGIVTTGDNIVQAHSIDTKKADSSFDRTTAIGIASLVIAVLILIGLIALITLLPAQTISQSVLQQASEQHKLLGSSLSRQMESYFNSLAYDLLGITNRPEIKSTARASRTAALQTLNDLARQRSGQIVSLVRLAADGSPIYAWPAAWNDNILDGKPLAWTVDSNFIDNVIQKRTVQFLQQPLSSGGAAYIMVAPVTEGTNVNEALVMQLDLKNYFESNFRTLKMTRSTQMFIFDHFGSEMFHYRELPSFRGDPAQIKGQSDTILLPDYPNDGQETVVSPVFVAFSGTKAQQSSFTIIITHSTSESQQLIYDTLQSLFLFGLGIIGFIVVFGLVIGRFLLRESNRRRKEEQRRSTARALLEMSRALNSSLDLNTVLERILGELANLLPHDSASVMLFNEEERAVIVAAETGSGIAANTPPGAVMPLTQVRGAREVLMTGKPALINDCLNDPRWTALPGSSIRAWLGVPLRVRQQPVGVLNINSNAINRFLPDDIDLAEAFADQAGVAIENARAHEFQIKAYESELETARAIQTSLLPHDIPPIPQLDLAARSIPARHVSGDYYQYYILPDGRIGLAVGDVSGKGIPAALLMAVITTEMRDEIIRTPEAAALLNELNTRLLPRMQQNNMNSGLLVSIFDPRTRLVEVANAGMVQPYLFNGGTWDFVPVGGYPIGASSRMSYSAKTLLLAPGSILVYISDGVVESQNHSQELYGFERLEVLLNEMRSDCSADEIADHILASVQDYLADLEPQDDITVVVMKSIDI